MSTAEEGKGPTRTAMLYVASGILSLLIVACTTLIIMGKPVTDLLTLIQIIVLPFLAGLGYMLYGKLEDVRSQVNGRMTQLIDVAAQSTPPPPPVTNGEVPNGN